MTHSRSLLLRISIGVGLLALACGAGLWALLTFRPPMITTYEDQVAYALRDHNIGYETITFGDMWPDRVNLQYGEQAGPVTIAVFVNLRNGTKASGWMECRRINQGCTLSLRDLGLRRVPLPEFSKQRTLPWLEWAERAIADVWN